MRLSAFPPVLQVLLLVAVVLTVYGLVRALVRRDYEKALSESGAAFLLAALITDGVAQQVLLALAVACLVWDWVSHWRSRASAKLEHVTTGLPRWARVPPALAWRHPELPTTWTRVLERNPEAMRPAPREDHVWLDLPGKVLQVPTYRLEFTGDPPEGS